jgi:mRNA interferase HigB
MTPVINRRRKSQKVPELGTLFLTWPREPGINNMRIISKKALKDFWAKEPAAQSVLEAWHAEAKNAEWSSPADVKAQYATASILRDGRVVFNIGGNKYRLVVWINYDFYTIYVRFVGTHKEYDEIDAQTI